MFNFVVTVIVSAFVGAGSTAAYILFSAREKVPTDEQFVEVYMLALGKEIDTEEQRKRAIAVTRKWYTSFDIVLNHMKNDNR